MQTKWIDLGEPTVKLKLGQFGGALYLFIVGLPNNTVQWQRAVNELQFVPAQNNRYLVRRVQEGESPRASSFRSIWPRAAIAMMERDAFYIDFAKNRREAQSTQEDRQTEIDLSLYQRLGRNANGDEVLTGALGRIVRMPDDSIVRESDQTLRAPMFLRASSDEELIMCANGFVRSMDKGEVQYRGDLERFINAVYSDEGAASDASRLGVVRAHIHAAMLQQVRAAHDTAQDAFGDAARLYDFLPPYWGQAPGAGAMPLPLAVIAQRLLGDTTDKTVIVPNAFDGATFSFLPEETRIHTFHGQRDLSGLVPDIGRVTWHQSTGELERFQADAIFFNADPEMGPGGQRKDYAGAVRMLRTLIPGGRAVLALAGDDPRSPGAASAGSEQFLRLLAARYDIEDAFELGAELTQKVGTGAALRIISLRNVNPQGVEPLHGSPDFPRLLPVVHSWDEVKSRVDETIARAAVREAQSDDISLKAIIEDNKVQRPYLPFSKIGQARTMVPSNLQGPLNSALSDVESRYGSIDEFVSHEIGFLDHTLGERLSPEQVDALGLSMSRIKAGRANILGDETGIGKGRVLGCLAVWANKQGKKVVFITDTANLFSDFYGGDLGDLEERGRFRPLILNSGEPIVDKNSPMDPPPVLIGPNKPADVARIVEENISLDDLGVNLVFATYSQLNGADSEKATWLKNQLSDALLIVDESHVAAGADSNISGQIQSMALLAWGVQYSSATWAKSSRNIGIYARALPQTINTASLAQTMKRGGEAFSELFSSMLARDGALTRREHDLSRMERVIEVDEVGRARNIAVSDAVAAVMNQIALISGDVDRMMVRLNVDVLRDLRTAREARAAGLKVDVFRSSFGAGSVLYQVSRRVLAALNAEHVARLCLKSLEDGMRPIVIFDDTGESLATQLLDQAAQVNAEGILVRPDVMAEPTIKDLLRQVLLRLSRVRVTEKNAEQLLAAEDARTGAVQAAAGDEDVDEAEMQQEAAPEPEPPVEDDDRADIEGAVAAMADAAPGRASKPGVRYVWVDDLPGISEEQKSDYKRGLKHVEDLIDSLPEVPLNAPDVVHHMLRAEGLRTGEISGRSFQLVRTGEGSLCRVVPRSKKKSFVTATVRAYQNGEIDVVVINRAAATGIGLHAQPRFADPRKRNMFWIQSPENAAQVSQLAGRGNRYDQACAPRMTFPTTGLYGELRQLMQANRKQAMLACNVRSSRDSSVRYESAPDLLNEVGEEAVRQVLIDNPGYCQRMGIPVDKIEDPACHPTQWLNRIPLLVHSDQEKIYSEFFAAFDEAILRHEMAGTNPLKAEEHDIGAQLADRSAFIGVETNGVGSAFDGPVYLQPIKWQERLTPMCWSEVESLILKSRRTLGASGRAPILGEHGAGMPLLDMDDLRAKTVTQLDNLMRIALASSEYENVAEVLTRATWKHPVRRAHDRMHWVEMNLSRLVPGATISIKDEANPLVQRQAVITAVDVPSIGREYQFGRWKIHTVAPRENKPVTYTLASIMNSTDPEKHGAQTVIGTDLFGGDDGDRMRAVFQRQFDTAPSGLRERVANVLTGNMYLASEWASATKLGRGIIFTDDRRVRHRGILLSREFSEHQVQHLPVRLWNVEMVHSFVRRALDGAADGVLQVDRTFGSAWARAQGDMAGSKDKIVFQRDVGVTITAADAPAVRRMGNALRAAQDKIRNAAAGNRKIAVADDPHHVKIMARGRQKAVILEAKTPEHLARALDVMVAGVGVELYMTRHSAGGMLAQEVIKDYFEARRLAALQDLERTERGGAEPGLAEERVRMVA